MRIGIDCRPLIGHKTGIGYYLWEILNQWALMGVAHELVLYSPRDFDIPTTLRESRLSVKKRILRLRPSELWMHTVAPVQIRADHLDVFWGPNYAMPLVPTGVPAVLTVHDLVHRVIPKTMKWMTYIHNRYGMERYVRYCQKVIVPSESTRNDLVEFVGLASDKVVVTPLGVSDRVQKKPGGDAILQREGLVDQPYFLAVGTMEPRKNLERVITAFVRFREQVLGEKGVAPSLVVVGANGWGGVATSIKVREERSVRYLGYVSDSEISALYRHACALIYVPLYEGFGLPPLEAMSLGCPVLVSNTSSLPEVVGGCGLYVNPTSVEEISLGMLRLWGDDKLRRTLARRGLERAHTMDWGSTAARTLQVLETAVREREN